MSSSPTSLSSFFFPFFRTNSNPSPTTPPSPSPQSSSWTPEPLPPVKLTGYAHGTETRLLDSALAEELREYLPARPQLQPVWTLAYSLEQHGASLSTLYSRCRELSKTSRPGSQTTSPAGAWVFVITSASGARFGAVVDQPFATHKGRYVGNGECFLWRLIDSDMDSAAEDSGFESDTENEPPRSRPSAVNGELKVYRYTGENEYCVLCENDGISIGGGEGKVGLFVEEGLGGGCSEECETFGNEILTGGKGRFEILGVEVWRVG